LIIQFERAGSASPAGAKRPAKQDGNLPFDEWTSVFGSERLIGALLDRLTHHVHILEINDESFPLATSKKANANQVKS
jgi:DNA replication protein DnaC